MASTAIHRSRAPPPVLPTNISISEFLMTYNPDDIPDDKVVLCEFDDPTTSLTYSSVRRLAAQAGAGLIATLNMKKGDTICILGENSVNWALLAHAVHWAGGCFCAVNHLATAYELVHYFGIAEPTAVATSSQNLAKVLQALDLAPKSFPKPQIVILEDGTPGSSSAGLTSFPSDFLRSNLPPLPPLDLSTSDTRQVPAAMCFSSGTSGKPKGVLLSHYGLINHMMCPRATDPALYNGFHREVFFPPFPHIYGIVAAVFASAYMGSYIVAMKRFDFAAYIKRCAEIKATILRTVPATAVMLVKEPWVRDLDLTSVRFIACAGAALQSQVVEQLQQILGGVDVIQGYGMSEVSISSLRGNWAPMKAGSCGRPFASTSVRVVDDDFNDVATDAQGEFVVRSPTMFMGYKNNAKETESSFKEGWFCTGDIGRVDKDGFFWLTDRKKELIKYKGNQVPPAEIEDVLLSHPKVKDAAVCAIYDEVDQTEVPMGYVVIEGSADEASTKKVLQEINAYVNERVSPYKRLRGGLEKIDEIPKGPTGKVLRRALPARLLAESKAAQLKAKL